MRPLEEFVSRRAAVGVYGLGFVGLHVAAALARRYRVTGYDPEALRLDGLRAGFDVGGVFSRERLEASGIVFAGSVSALAECPVIVVALATPRRFSRRPELAALERAFAEIGAVMRPGTLVVIESTLPSRTLAELAAPALAKASGLVQGVDFHCAYTSGGIGKRDREYRIVDPLRNIRSGNPVAGAFAREFFAPLVDARVVSVSAQLGVSSRERNAPPPPREIAIGVFAGLHLLMMPWFFGGQALSGQWIALALALGAFVCLLIPDASSGVDARALALWREWRLNPVFLAGLVLFTLFVFQHCNPRWLVDTDGGAWGLIPEPARDGLPAGVTAPFSRSKTPGGMNALRTLLIFAPPWLMLLSLISGVRSRRVASGVWVATVVSGVLVGVFAIGTRLSAAESIFGKPTAGVATPHGPFLYQNQAGAYLYLSFFLAVALALRVWRRAPAGDGRGGPHWLAAAACLPLLVAALMSNSFATAAVLAVSPLAIVPAVALARHKRAGRPRSESRDRLPAMIAGAALVALLCVVLLSQADFTGVVDKVRAKLELARNATLDDRASLRDATLAMYADANPLFGTGAGSYRWLAPMYFEKIPAFCDAQGRLVAIAAYAHCDWLQILTEWGLIGLACVAAIVGWFLAVVRAGVRTAVPLWPVVFGLFALGAHAGWDYLFFNPAILALVATALFLCHYFMRAYASAE